jgi:hypothetical protein
MACPCGTPDSDASDENVPVFAVFSNKLPVLPVNCNVLVFPEGAPEVFGKMLMGFGTVETDAPACPVAAC